MPEFFIHIGHQLTPPVRYSLPAKQAAKQIFGYDNVKVYDLDEVKETGALGLPVFMPLQLEEIIADENTYGVAALKINTAIIDISLPKVIVKTPMQGKDGTAKQHIANGDYLITIKGIIAGKRNFPIDEVSHMWKFAEAPVSIKVTHEILSALGIYEIVIENAKLIPAVGFENIQPFEWQCVSDMPFELQVKSEESKLLNG